MRRTLFLVLLIVALPAAAWSQPITGSRVPCTGGVADRFDCRNVDLLAYLPITAIGGTSTTQLNDIWGWTDPTTGREYAVVGRTDGTSFVDVTDPLNPVYLGNLPTRAGTSRSVWRDVKVYDTFAFVVADAMVHGMQVFDLRRLRNAGGTPETFTADAHYDGFTRSHNIFVNEATGFAYAVGTNTCGGGLHMIDVRDPLNPTFAGCYAEAGTGRAGRGYTHDTQCVVYHGPDEEHRGREICFASNETDVVIADVTDKAAPARLSVSSYPTAQYVHQGWLTEDHRFFYQDDELDELNLGFDRTRTFIWDVTDLDDPVLVTEYRGVSSSIDHNQYIVGDRVYQANYTSGLRILDASDPAVPVEVGFFDTYPASDLARGPDGMSLFEGAWSTYPFYDSGIVTVSSIGEGLFVLAPTGAARPTVAAEDDLVPSAFALSPAYPNPFNPATRFTLDVDAPQHVQLAVYDLLGREVARLHDGPLAAGAHAFTWTADDAPSGRYFIRARGATAEVTTTVTLAK